MSQRRTFAAAGVAAASGVGVVLLWAAAAGLMLLRTRPAGSLVSRPDRWFGGEGAAHGPVLALLAIASGALLVSFGAGLAGTIRGTADRPLIRFAAAVPLALLALSGVSAAAVALFPPDANLYMASPARGAGALGFVVGVAAAELLTGLLLSASGRLRAGALSFAAGLVTIWQSVATAVGAALAGAAQPQLDAFVPAQGIAAGWLVVLSVWLLASSRRGGPAGAPEATARRRVGATAVMGLVGVVATLAVVGSAVPVVAPALAPELAGRTRAESIQVAAITRTYRVYRPEHVSPRAALVIALHGVFGSGFQMERNAHLDEEADRLGWIVAYPDGVSDGWSAFGTTDYWGRHPGADDVPFIAALIDRLEASDGVDAGSVFVTGMSRGGMMTHRVGCELAGRVAAIAPVSGNMATATGSAAGVPCYPTRPVSVLAVHGTSDGVIPFAGGHVDIDYAPFEDVIAKWRAVDGCAGAAAATRAGPVTTSEWSCASGSSVAAQVVDGGGHVWPAGIDRVIVDFFEAHRRA